MRNLLLSVALSPLPILAQLSVEGPVRLTGPPEERVIMGLATPTRSDAALTVEAALVGTANWSEAVFNDTTVVLSPVVPMTGYRAGQLLRFIAPTDLSGPSTLSCTGLPPLILERPDGLPPARGQIRAGALCEVVNADDRWILINLVEEGCPSCTTLINDRLCMETASAADLFFFPAADRCARMGGRLCKWDEFYIACTQHAAELTGLTTAWEWLDDSSNHAHSAVQVGLAGCTAQRWANPQSVTLGRSRCCFEPK